MFGTGHFLRRGPCYYPLKKCIDKDFYIYIGYTSFNFECTVFTIIQIFFLE